MEKFLFVLGSNWKLSLAELDNFLKFSEFKGKIIDYSANIAVVRFEKLHEENSVCVVDTGGVVETSLIQLALLLGKLSGRKIYALFKEYSYSYTRTDYPFAKRRFCDNILPHRLSLLTL